MYMYMYTCVHVHVPIIEPVELNLLAFPTHRCATTAAPARGLKSGKVLHPLARELIDAAAIGSRLGVVPSGSTDATLGPWQFGGGRGPGAPGTFLWDPSFSSASTNGVKPWIPSRSPLESASDIFGVLAREPVMAPDGGRRAWWTSTTTGPSRPHRRTITEPRRARWKRKSCLEAAQSSPGP